MLDDSFQGLPGQIETIEWGIAMFERGDHAQGLRVVVETAITTQASIQRPLARVTERGMTEIVGQCERLGQILIKPKLAGERTGDLGDFQRVGEPGAVMVALMKHKNLRLVLEATECRGMNDPVAIPPERAARPARRIRELPPAAQAGVAGIGRAGG